MLCTIITLNYIGFTVLQSQKILPRFCWTTRKGVSDTSGK